VTKLFYATNQAEINGKSCLTYSLIYSVNLFSEPVIFTDLLHNGVVDAQCAQLEFELVCCVLVKPLKHQHLMLHHKQVVKLVQHLMFPVQVPEQQPVMGALLVLSTESTDPHALFAVC